MNFMFARRSETCANLLVVEVILLAYEYWRWGAGGYGSSHLFCGQLVTELMSVLGSGGRSILGLNPHVNTQYKTERQTWINSA